MDEWDEEPDLNVTPIVDVMLVLLAILMVTTPTIVYHERINLPDGTELHIVQKTPELELRITKDREVFYKREKFTISEFPDNFILIGRKYSLENTVVYIKADEALKYKDVMFVLKSVKEAGFTKVSLVTSG